jgi:acyl-homoserine-lactone acylase
MTPLGPNRRRRARWAAAALLPAAALVAAGVWRTPHLDTAALARRGTSHSTRILRDTWGVPHVFGKTDADAAYGLAYAHCEDDFATIQAALLAARGRLASVFGRGGAANDYMVALMGVREQVEARYEKDLSPEARAVCEGYADGVNHYAALHPSQVIAWLYPVSGKDVVAGFVHKMPLFFGLDSVLKGLFGSERPRLGPSGPKLRPPSGSNAFAVAPRRSADSHTRLAVNSHQPWEGPVAWYEAHVHSEEGWDAVGGVFPGAPVILHGHNRRLGWAHTVNRPDLIDVYVLDVDPKDPDRYRFDGSWKTLQKRTVGIDVKLLGPVHWTFHREALASVHGPVVRQPHGTYALRLAGSGEVRHVEQWYRMNKARSFEEWRDAMRLLALPMFNTVYADADGNIFYVYNGRLPVRRDRYDWRQFIPGDSSEAVWSEYLSFDALPQVLNPPSGFIQSCNSSPFQTTDGVGNPDPAQYPDGLGIETRMTNRALRALETFGRDPSIDAAEFDAYKYDLRYSPRSVVAEAVRRLVESDAAHDPALREAVDLLRSWDLGTQPDNRAAALAILTVRPTNDGELESIETSALLQRLRETTSALKRHFGRIDPAWSDVNRLRRGRIDLGLGGGPDVLHSVNGKPSPDGRLVGYAGDSYVLLADWDPQGRVTSRSIHPYGTATLDATSPHYADQSPLFVQRQLKRVWMDEREIRAHLEREYRPGEEMSR